jgi:flagellar biosynthesis chaperone FliJ
MKHRLDTVVAWRERQEENARRQWGDAVKGVTSAESQLRQARDAAAVDQRVRGSAMEWELFEADRATALKKVRAAEATLASAKRSERETQGKHLDSHRKAEAVRRVADSRKSELQLEANKKEQKAADAFASASMLRLRRAQ